MKKDSKGKKINDVINDHLLPVVEESVEMFDEIYNAIKQINDDIYSQTNAILNENQKCDIIFKPFMHAIFLLDNVQNEFLRLFGYAAKGMLNDLNMKSGNMKSYIDMSQEIIETSEKIVKENNEFFSKFNEMKSVVGQLHSNSKKLP